MKDELKQLYAQKRAIEAKICAAEESQKHLAGGWKLYHSASRGWMAYHCANGVERRVYVGKSLENAASKIAAWEKKHAKKI